MPKPTRRHIAIEEEQEKESDDDDEAENFTSLNAVRSAALEKLKVLSEKYGRKKDDDFDDFDIGELDLSDDDNEEGNEDENDH